jgi:IS30 family transposase
MERSSIWLLHKRGKSQRQIVRELGRSRVTVARALREPVDRAATPRDRPSIVDPYREDIGRWLGEA